MFKYSRIERDPLLPRGSSLAAILCVACGGQSTTTGVGSTGGTKAEQAKVDPRVAIVPDGAESEPVDSVFDNPQLASGVTSIYQLSYFYDPDEATDPPIAVAMVDGAKGVGLSGAGELTMLLVFDKSSSMLFDWDGKTR